MILSTQNSRGWQQIYAPSFPYEDEVARRWWSLPLGSLLPLTTGGYYQLLFPGRRGGSAGPDVRDAVLVASSYSLEEKLCGDIEFHVRSSDWRLHRHHLDPRYNAVMLHVVLICDDPHPTLRQDGTAVPVCSLYDLHGAASSHRRNLRSHQISQVAPSFNIPDREAVWPCQRILATLSADERDRLIMRAGLLRFEQKTHDFVEQLHAVVSTDVLDGSNAHDTYDICLIPALAEGLGYGRDREFFRASGQRLLQRQAPLPEPLGHTEQPAPLDARRLSILALLFRRWRIRGAWQTLRACLLTTSKQDNVRNADDGDRYAIILAILREAFTTLGLSLARTDILIVNVVLPFAAAVALLEHDRLLAQQAHELYTRHPGLTSNSITRAMVRQLQLAREPEGSCRQQGLHYIYRQTCREKRCNVCIMGKNDV